MIEEIKVYDLETNSADAGIENPVLQVAVKTYDNELNPADGGEMLYVQLGVKYANPFATAVHGLSPTFLQENGMSSLEFSHSMKEMFPEKNKDETATMSFNGHFFDDKVMRHTFFNNGVDPYHMEQGGGGTSYDVFKLAQLASVRNSDSLNIPQNDKGNDILKLEALSSANKITHLNPHEALSDVIASADLAKIIKDKDPRLWEEFEITSNKFSTKELLEEREALIRVTKNSYGIYTTPVLPLVPNLLNPNEFFGIKLDKPKLLAKIIDKFSPEELEGMMLVDKSDRPQGLKSDTGHPFVKLKAKNGPPLLDGADIIENKESTFNLKMDDIQESLNILKDRQEDTVKAITSAFKGDPKLQYDDKDKNHADMVYSVKFTPGDRILMDRVTEPDENGMPAVAGKDFNVFDTAKHFSENNVTHLKVLTSLKFDSALSQHDKLTPENIVDTIQSFTKDTKNPEAKYEALIFMETLNHRLDSFADKDGNSISMMDKFTNDINEVIEKRPDDYARNQSAINDAKSHNQVLALALENVKEFEINLKAELPQTLDQKFTDWEVEIKSDKNQHYDRFMEKKEQLSANIGS